MFTWEAIAPPFFRGQVLNRDTPTLVADTDELSSSIRVADST
jgi:hypothetical protein